jgi:hypothetical protein
MVPVELAATLFVTMLSGWTFVCYRMVRIEIRETQDDLENMRGQITLMGRKVDAVVQSHNGARVMAEGAIIHAQRAEALAREAKKVASQPIVLVASPANDAAVTIANDDKIKGRARSRR